GYPLGAPPNLPAMDDRVSPVTNRSSYARSAHRRPARHPRTPQPGRRGADLLGAGAPGDLVALRARVAAGRRADPVAGRWSADPLPQPPLLVGWLHGDCAESHGAGESLSGLLYDGGKGAAALWLLHLGRRILGEPAGCTLGHGLGGVYRAHAGRAARPGAGDLSAGRDHAQRPPPADDLLGHGACRAARRRGNALAHRAAL